MLAIILIASALTAAPPAGVVTYLKGGPGEPQLALRHVPGRGRPVLYVHGATFPSALSVAYRFKGESWMDDLARRGFDVWAFDFAGFGLSGRPAGSRDAPAAGPPIDEAPAAARQLARVVDHVLRQTRYRRLSIIAHSRGTIVAGLYASRHPQTVDRLVLYGPITWRAGPLEPETTAWSLVSVADQLERFTKDVPVGHSPVLIEPDLATWGPAYLASDPQAGGRDPPAVQVPSGPSADVASAHGGRLAYDPARIRAPTLIVRGAWDSSCPDADAGWLLRRLGAREKGDVKIPEGTHLMLLERSRVALFEATARFLQGAGDRVRESRPETSGRRRSSGR